MQLIKCISNEQPPDFDELCGPVQRRKLEPLAYMVDPSKIIIPMFIESNLTSHVKKFMFEVIECFGEPMPHMNLKLVLKCGEEVITALIFIPCGIFPNMMAVFTEMRTSGVISPTTCDAWVYKLWHRYFPHVRIRQSIPFAKCQVCEDLRAALRSAPTEAMRAIIAILRRTHTVTNRLARTLMMCKDDIAKTFDSDVLMLYCDSMDNVKTALPHQAQSTKTVDNAGEPIRTQLTGVYAPGKHYRCSHSRTKQLLSSLVALLELIIIIIIIPLLSLANETTPVFFCLHCL
jgi:hypothetical protein